jgi:hypothetical protein
MLYHLLFNCIQDPAIVDNLMYMKKNTCWIAVWSRPGSWGDSNLVRLDTKGIRKTRIGWTG